MARFGKSLWQTTMVAALAAGMAMAPAWTSPARAQAPEASTTPTDQSPSAVIRQYLDPVVADEFNPDVTDATRTTAKPRRGGVLRVRTPSDFGDMNPITSTSQPDRMAQNLMFDAMVGSDPETRESIPVIAWTFAKADLLKLKDGTEQYGILLEKGDENNPDAPVVFVPEARRVTFLKTDVESFDVVLGTLTLTEERGGAKYEGKLVVNDWTIEVNTAHAPGMADKALRTTVKELATWTDQLGATERQRPFRKEECAFWFTIRPGVTWHDGKPLTAQDVKFTFETITNVNVDAPGLRQLYLDVESCAIEADGATLHFRSRKPFYNQFEALGGLALVPRHIFNPEQYGGDAVAFAKAFNEHPYREKPTANGPYRIKEWKKGQSLTLERAPDYWASKLPAGTLPKWSPEMPWLDEIQYILISEKATAIKELEKGNIDADMDIEPDTWGMASTQTPEFTANYVRAKRFGFLYTFIALNNNRPIFKDPETRRALALLIPREQIGKDIYFGLSQPVSGPFYAKGPGYNRDVPQVPYDPRAARTALRKAGWLDRDGDGIVEKEIDGAMVPFEFEYMIHGAREYHQKVADIVKESVEQAGIKMTIRKIDFNVLMDKTRDQDYDAARAAWGADIEPDPFQIWHSSQAENKGSNYVAYRSERADRLMEELRETFWPPRRWEIAREIHAIIAEDQPAIFLEGFYETYFYNRKLRGVKLYPSQYPYDFREWYWAQ